MNLFPYLSLNLSLILLIAGFPDQSKAAGPVINPGGESALTSALFVEARTGADRVEVVSVQSLLDSFEASQNGPFSPLPRNVVLTKEEIDREIESTFAIFDEALDQGFHTVAREIPVGGGRAVYVEATTSKKCIACPIANAPCDDLCDGDAGKCKRVRVNGYKKCKAAQGTPSLEIEELDEL